jgi:MYXO-CTERM domain-containing protein
MTEEQVDRRPARAARLALRPLLVAAGIYHAVLGAVMVIAPREFYDSVGAFPPYNDHYVRDVSTFYLALGAVMLIAAARRSWQVPVLFLAVLQYGLHVLNHLWDVSDSDPGWVGPVDVAALGLIALALAWLLRIAQAEERR